MASYSVTVTHPFSEDPVHTLDQVRAKLRRWYGCTDADRWYESERRRIADACARDPHGMLLHTTLEAFWTDRQARAKWVDPFLTRAVDASPVQPPPQDARQDADSAVGENRETQSDDSYAMGAA